MKHTKKIFFLFIVLGFFLFSFSSDSNARRSLKYELGFSINPTAGTGIVSYALLAVDSAKNKIISKKPITEGQFIMYGKGLLKCKANPKKEDLFKKYLVDCGLILDYPKLKRGVEVQDTLWKEMQTVCIPIFDIWKIRYSIHPKYGTGKFVKGQTFPKEDEGWSANRHFPSYKQTLFLQKYYGISNIQDYFRGEKMFLLFRDMQNEDWITKYKEIS